MRPILIASAALFVAASTVLGQTAASTPSPSPSTKPGQTSPQASTPTPSRSAQTAAKAALNKRQPNIKFNEIALADAIEFLRDSTDANFAVDWKSLEEVGISKESPVTLNLRYAKTRVVLKNLLEAAAPGLLTFYVDENVINITTQVKADEKMIVRTYPVQDLLVEVPDFEGPSLSLTDQANGRNGGRRNGGGNNGSGNNGGSGGIFDSNGNGGERNRNEEKGKTRAERGQDLVDMIQTTVRPEVWDINGGKAKIKFFNGTLIITAPRSVQEAIGGPID